MCVEFWGFVVYIFFSVLITECRGQLARTSTNLGNLGEVRPCDLLLASHVPVILCHFMLEFWVLLVLVVFWFCIRFAVLYVIYEIWG